MAQATSDHIKPCNIGQSEAHNRRSAEYLAHINKDAIYIRADLSYRNEAWVSDVIGKSSLQEYHNLIAQMVKEKTGRALQAKSRERVDKKTGKVKIVNGSSPIRESVIVCKEDTTIDELNRYAKLCHDTWGITALQIFIHRDEGHYEIPHDPTSWIPNYHAHIVWDWMNHDTGKSIKLSKQDTSQMQDLVAVALGMERGKRKEDTNREHLERNDFILAKQKKEAELVEKNKAEAQNERDKLVQETEKVQTELSRIKQDNVDKENRNAALDAEIAEKEERVREADKAATESIKSGIANLLGRGKYAAISEENKKLKESIAKSNADHEVKLESAVRLEANKWKKAAEVQAAESNRRIAAMMSEKQRLAEENLILRKTMDNQICWRDIVLGRLAALLYEMDKFFKKVINSIIGFARSVARNGTGNNGHRNIFTNEEAADIKTAINGYASTNIEREAVGRWLVGYATELGSLNREESTIAEDEVRDVAKGRYDWRITRGNGGGLSM